MRIKGTTLVSGQGLDINASGRLSELRASNQTELGELGYGISGGQKQRLSITRAFLKDAPIVILDEATSSVDPINERKIQTAITNLVHKRTVIVIAHHLKTIQNADQIIVFDNGAIVEKGSHATLLSNKGLYQQMWNQLYD